jgi:hypothetical protein
MATNGPQFPSGLIPPIGVTASLLKLVTTVPTTTMFTATEPGWYLCTPLLHLVSSNGAGTLTGTVTFANSPSFPLTPTLGSLQDGSSAARAFWMNAGESITISATATGLTGTVFNLQLSVIQLL